MPAQTIRVRPVTHAKLKALAAASGRSISDVIDDAIEVLRRERLLADANAAYERLQQDPAAWAEELAERAVWDAATGLTRQESL